MRCATLGGARSACRSRAEDDLVLVVHDDGTGTAAPRPDGVGLASLAERADEVGGRLEIASVEGAGTSVRLRVPAAESLRRPPGELGS